jgi:bacteriocin-like protein
VVCDLAHIQLPKCRVQSDRALALQHLEEPSIEKSKPAKPAEAAEDGQIDNNKMSRELSEDELSTVSGGDITISKSTDSTSPR